MMRPARHDAERGVILINVLAVLAIASMAVLVMVSLQEAGISRTIRFAEAAQASAINRGGEASAITALRRDAAQSPRLDHAGEAWAAISDEDVAIENGTFSLSIEDAQGKFNVNTVTGGQASLEILRRIVVAAGLEPEAATRILAYIRTAGPAASMQDLSRAGLTAEDIAALSRLATALPDDTDVNLNAASEPVIAALFGNAVPARILVAARARKGFLTQDDIFAARTVMPVGGTLSSSWFRVTAQTTIGDTTQRTTSLLHRQGRSVAVIRRTNEMAAPG